MSSYFNRGLNSVEIFEKYWKWLNCGTKTLKFGPNFDCSRFDRFLWHRSVVFRYFAKILAVLSPLLKYEENEVSILIFQKIFFLGEHSTFFNIHVQYLQYICIKRILNVASHFTKKHLNHKCLRRIANTMGRACALADIRQLCFCGHFNIH